MTPREQQDAADMMGKDIWVKYTTKDGKHHVAYHRVWDIGRFMIAKQAEMEKLGGKAEQVLKP